MRILGFMLLAVVAGFSPGGAAGDDFTADLHEAALSGDCLDWRIDGVCLFLRCGLFGCRVVATPRISHRLPDLVVQSYSTSGDPPWRAVNPGGSTELAGGAAAGAGHHRFTDALQFFEADVIGNPVARKMGMVGRFLCRSDVTPMKQYFLSIADSAAWRALDGGVEAQRPEAVTPGVREIGSASSTWGPVYPRQGFLIQQDPARAAAVVAARAADVVTADPSGHVVSPYLDRQSARRVRRGDPEQRNPQGCRESGGRWVTQRGDSRCVAEVWRQWRSASSDTASNWQLIRPRLKTQCEGFGGGGSPSSVDPDGQYAWVNWRQYRCCRVRGSFLGVF